MKRWLYALGVTLPVCPTTPQPAADATVQCRVEFERASYAAAEQSCADAFAVSGERSVGALAAKASYLSGNKAAVAAWLPKLGPSQEAGEVLALLGTIARDAGDHSDAITQWERGKQHLTDAEDWGKASKLGTWIGKEYWKRAEFSLALSSFQDAAALADRGRDTGPRFAAYGFLSDFLFELGAVRWAETWHARAIALPELNASRQRSIALRTGTLAWSAGRVNVAKAAYEEALAGYLAADDLDNVRVLHLNLAEVAAEMGRNDAAVTHLAQANAIREQLDDVSAPPNRFVTASEQYYGSLVALASGDAARALELLGHPDPEAPTDWQWQLELQRGKALLQLRRVAEAQTALRRATKVIETLRRAAGGLRIRDRVARRRREPFELLLGIHSRNADASEAVWDYERARSRAFLDAVLGRNDRIETAEAFNAQLDGGASVARALNERALATRGETTGPSLRPNNGAVVAWFSGEAATYALVFDGTAWRIESLDVASSDLRALVDEIVVRLDEGSELELPSSISSIFEGIPAGMPLAIVADGALVDIPFAAARIQGIPLGERNPMRRMISLFEAASDEAGVSAPRVPRVVLSDPEGDLPGAQREGQYLAREQGFEVVSGSVATVKRATAASAAGLLHIAAHVGLDKQGAYVALSDGRLHAFDLSAWTQAPVTVILASCASARGDDSDTWGSLPAAFLAAGSRQVLATLWSVQDDDAHELVRLFYAHGGAERPVAGLQSAQRQLRERGWSARRWAAYVVFGASDPALHATHERKPE
ncbi:MAG: CHAT domain-containing protein [Nannocystaceae bacterium]|nr:CHAT domain-containing protein [Nannocystaceae bacterium]